MRDAENTAAEGDRQARAPRGLGDHARQIHHDAEALATTTREATDGVQRYLTAQMEQRPFRTLGVAAGVGYLLGGGLSSRLTAVLVGAVARVATTLVVRELASRILQNGSAAAQPKSS